MAYADLIPDVREALGVSSQHDASIMRGIRRNAQLFLRNYNFRESVRRTAAVSLALNATSFPLSADAGKVKAVRLRQLSGGTYLYKRLRRREEGQLPQPVGIAPLTVKFYWFEPPNIVLDTPMPELGVQAEVWYQSESVDFAESFLSTRFSDVLLHQTISEMAPGKRKPEVRAAYQPILQLDVAVLANYLQEIEFNDLEMMMDPETPGSTARYPSN